MDIRKVKKLIELLEESNIAEIEIREGEESVRISRSSTVMPKTTASFAPADTVADNLKVAEPPTKVTDYTDEGHVVKAPMVGVFYTASGPNEPAFVSKGQNIAEGQVLCIIEAMKIMNQIEADSSGRLLKILVENGEAVEYGQPLFVIAKT